MANLNQDPLIGQQLDEYELVSLLGYGGMARVYRGRDIRLKRDVAIKVIDAVYRADEAYRARFEREAQAIAQLEHPHIVRLYRYGEVSGLFYMAMQYIPGRDLSGYLAELKAQDERIPALEAARFVRELCGALDYAHSKGIIHRDREDLNEAKLDILRYTNRVNLKGDLRDALKDADVFIGVSVGNLLEEEDIRSMAKDPIIFALANPTPEIMPDKAYAAGAAVVATGRSDLPNQVNNALGFPGIFRGALDAKAKRISARMKLVAAYAIAEFIREPTKDMIIPATLNEEVAWKVAKAVKAAALEENI